jgi:hypothetical protein
MGTPANQSRAYLEWKSLTTPTAGVPNSSNLMLLTLALPASAGTTVVAGLGDATTSTAAAIPNPPVMELRVALN